MSLEQKKMKLMKNKVLLGIEEMELKIMEREEDISRMEDNILVSKKKVEELEEEIKSSKEA